MSDHSDDSPYHPRSPGSRSRSRRKSGRRRTASRGAAAHGTPAPAKHAKPASGSHAPAGAKSGSRRKRGGGRKRGGPGKTDRGVPTARHHSPNQLVSHPTTRGAYVDTRAWLVRTYGNVCAYCGLTFAPRLLTLDHVAPRRGQSAYDRRDNLVLACTTCNAAKRDQAPLAFLLGRRSRAANLVRYGAHLSHGLLELARSLAPRERSTVEIDYAHAADDDDASPYRD